LVDCDGGDDESEDTNCDCYGEDERVQSQLGCVLAKSWRRRQAIASVELSAGQGWDVLELVISMAQAV